MWGSCPCRARILWLMDGWGDTMDTCLNRREARVPLDGRTPVSVLLGVKPAMSDEEAQAAVGAYLGAREVYQKAGLDVENVTFKRVTSRRWLARRRYRRALDGLARAGEQITRMSIERPELFAEVEHRL